MPLNLLNDLLNDTQSILIHWQVNQHLEHWIKDEVDVLLLQTQQHLLQHVSAVWVEGHCNHVLTDPVLQFLLLCPHVDHFYQALHRVGALFVAGNTHYVGFECLQDFKSLCRGWALKEFLAEVVSVLVNHEFMEMVDAFINCKSHEVGRSSG